MLKVKTTENTLKVKQQIIKNEILSEIQQRKQVLYEDRRKKYFIKHGSLLKQSTDDMLL